MTGTCAGFHADDRLRARAGSPAIRGCAEIALQMAGIALADVACFDLYSCFASAVEVACHEIGLAE
ncbi:MAG: hypothetical protein VW339_12860, partial [Quisquiliibacterium sp.]